MCVVSPVLHGVQGLAQIHRCVMCDVCVCECVYVCGQPCVAWRTRARTDTQVRDVWCVCVRVCVCVCVYSPVLNGVQGLAQIYRCVVCLRVCVCMCVDVCVLPVFACTCTCGVCVVLVFASMYDTWCVCECVLAFARMYDICVFM